MDCLLNEVADRCLDLNEVVESLYGGKTQQDLNLMFHSFEEAKQEFESVSQRFLQKLDTAICDNEEIIQEMKSLKDKLNFIVTNKPPVSSSERENYFRLTVSDNEVSSSPREASYMSGNELQETPGYGRGVSPCDVKAIQPSPRDFLELYTTPKTPKVPSALRTVQPDEPSLSVPFISELEFRDIPAYMKGRMKVSIVNEFVDIINNTINKKYGYLKQPRGNLKTNDMIYNTYPKWKSQQKDINGETFVSEHDFNILSNFKLSKKEHSIITILRHCKRLKQTRIKNCTFYIVSS